MAWSGPGSSDGDAKVTQYWPEAKSLLETPVIYTKRLYAADPLKIGLQGRGTEAVPVAPSTNTLHIP